MSRSSSCVRALSRATLACRGWGHWSSNARCDHRDRRSFSSSSLKILCPLGLDLVSFVFARRVRYYSISLSLSRSLGQERDHLYQKGIRPRRRRSLSKVSKRLSREKSKRYRPISNRVFARLRHKSAVFSLLRKATILDRIPDSESNRTRFCFRQSSRTQNGSKNNETPFLRFNKANKNPLSNNNNNNNVFFLPVTDACSCVLSSQKREKERER